MKIQVGCVKEGDTYFLFFSSGGPSSFHSSASICIPHFSSLLRPSRGMVKASGYAARYAGVPSVGRGGVFNCKINRGVSLLYFRVDNAEGPLVLREFFLQKLGLQTRKPCTQMQMKQARIGCLISVPRTDVRFNG